MAIGDIIQQEIEYQRNILTKRYDYGRLSMAKVGPIFKIFNSFHVSLARMFLIGLVFGPMHHFWYKWLQKMLPTRDFKTVTKKIFFDELIMSPICIVTFFYGMGILERMPLKEIKHETSEKFIEVYMVRL